MSTSSAEQQSRIGADAASHRGFSYVWVHVLVAALAMVATLPGRTHGLGLIAVPLMSELRIDERRFADVNLWATLLGALFCLPVGWFLDRFSARTMLSVVLLLLGSVVLVMSRCQADWWIASLSLPGTAEPTTVAMGLFVLILLTRGLGQSALSVVSLSIMSRSAGQNRGFSYGVYSVAVAVGFMAAFRFCGLALGTWQADWRELWGSIGWILLASGVMLPLFIRSSLLATSDSPKPDCSSEDRGGSTFGEAMRSRSFWVFALATTLYGGIASGVSLFNQSILHERGFDKRIYYEIAALMPLIGLLGNLGTGWLSTRWPLGRLLAVSMMILAISLGLFPYVETLTQLYLYGGAFGIAGGMVTVLFFAVWRKRFGLIDLGKIQGSAQLLTVLGSALGPVLFAETKESFGSYRPLFWMLAPICGLFGIVAWFTPIRVPTSHTSGKPG